MRVAQALWSLFCFAVALIPFWIFLGIEDTVQPRGFWENLVLTGLSLFFLGFWQLVMLVLFVAVLFVIWE